MDDTLIPYLIPVFTFVSVVAFIGASYYLWDMFHEAGTAKMQRRLRLLSAGGAHGEELMQKKHFSDIPFVNEVLHGIPRVHAIDRVLVEGNVNLTVVRFFLVQLITIVVVCLALTLAASIALMIALPIGFVAGIALPYIFINHRAQERRKKFIAMMPDALDFIARSLRAGNPFTATIKMASEEIADPVGREFAITFDEINYGLEVEDALYNFGERIHSEEVQYFITAVIIQKVTGGNLADVLNRIAEVMRSRAKTYREVDIEAAEMRVSANVLIALPFFVAGAVAIMNPAYFEPLFDNKLGQMIILAQIGLMLIGYFVIRRMIHFRV